MKSVDYLKRLQDEKGWSGYKIAKEIGVSSQYVYQILHEQGIMNDYMALQLADLLEINEMEVIAQCNLERARRKEEKQFWKKKIQTLVASVIVTVSMFFGGIGANSSYTDGEISVKNSAFLATSVVLVLFLYIIYFA